MYTMDNQKIKNEKSSFSPLSKKLSYYEILNVRNLNNKKEDKEI